MASIARTIFPALFSDDDTFDPTIVRPTEYFGAQILYRSATGLEKAMADADAVQLFNLNAELIIENWDPWQVQTQNLPFLAWAMGVNLWPSFWSEREQRSWVARQWYLKSIRGTRKGLEEFIWAMRGELKHVVAPPATAYTSKSYTLEERAAYVARFPQLRVYPYVMPGNQPWNCMTRNWHNGLFANQFFPLNAGVETRYKRIATLWDQGQETTLTVRRIVSVGIGEQVREYDEILWPGRKTNKYFMGQPGKFPYPYDAHTTDDSAYGIFFGRIEGAEARYIKIPRDGSLTINYPKAQYQTASIDEEFISIYPEHRFQTHYLPPRPHRYSLFAGRDQLRNKFLPKSIAWQYVYEVWYIFDPARVPDERRRNLFLGAQWFGIPWFTARVKIKVFGKLSPSYFLRYVRGYWKPANYEVIQHMRDAVNASRALRDTVLIDTKVMRQIEVRDLINADGTHSVGEMIES